MSETTAKEVDCRGCAHARSGPMGEPCNTCTRGPEGKGTRWVANGETTQRNCGTCAHQHRPACPGLGCSRTVYPYWLRRADGPAAAIQPATGANAGRKHSHYFKSVEGLKTVDVYRVLSLFAVTDQALGHAIKKLLVAGGRGAGKDIGRDVQEAIDTLVRWQEMRAEDQGRDGK